MNKIITGLVCAIVILGAIITAVAISRPNESEEQLQIETNVADENILDECTDEYEEMVESNTLVEETSSEGEKISPNCSIIFRRHYKDCGHTIEQYSSVPTELVNKTEEDLQEQYQGWTIEEFSRNQIILYRDFDSECGEHYVLREKDGKVVVYLKTGDTEELVEETDIATEFLTETDRIELQNGIEANGRVELNQLIEDYE